MKVLNENTFHEKTPNWKAPNLKKGLLKKHTLQVKSSDAWKLNMIQMTSETAQLKELLSLKHAKRMWLVITKHPADSMSTMKSQVSLEGLGEFPDQGQLSGGLT